MELTFLTIGSLFFFVLVGVDPAPRPVPPPLRVGLLFGAMAIHAFFSLALMSSSSVLGASYFTLMHRPYATDLLADQHLGGGIGWAMGELPMLLVVGAIFVQWVRADEREARRMDRAADRAESHAGPPAVPTRPRP
jgi:putative copper resistance protein D